MRRALLLALAAITAIGCTLALPTEGWTRGGMDAGVDASALEDAGAPDAYRPDPARCLEPVGQCNALSGAPCDGDEGCYLVAGATQETLECLIAGSRADGVECDMPNHCSPGSTCVFGECKRHCCALDDCGDRARCIPVIGNDPEGSAYVGVCFASDVCDPIAQNCSFGTSCVAFEDRAVFDRVCIPVGSSPPGRACTGFAECARGSRCAPQNGDVVCRRYCDTGTGNPCPGACEAMGGSAPATLGYCVEPPG